MRERKEVFSFFQNFEAKKTSFEQQRKTGGGGVGGGGGGKRESPIRCS